MAHKIGPECIGCALALANVLQVASTKLVAFTKSTLLNVSTAVHVLVLALQAQSKLNNFNYKKSECKLTFFVSQKISTKSNSIDSVLFFI